MSSDASSGGDAASSSSSTTGDTGIPEGCGDDELEAPEECDDGNNVSGDGCNADCTLGGQLVWQHLFDGPYALDDRGHRVAVDSHDNVIAVGITYAPGNSDRNGWVMKLDDDGQDEWDDIFNSGVGTSNEAFWGVAIGPGDEVIVSGYVANASNSSDAVIRCYSPDGALLWSYVYEGPLWDGAAHDVAVDPNGDVVFVGSVRDPDDGSFLTRVAKLTLDGDPVWSEAYPNGNTGGAVALAVDAAGSIFYGGAAVGTFLRKLSPDAVEEWLWENPVGTFTVDGIVVDAFDDVFVGGSIGNPRHSRLARHFGDGSGIDWDVEWMGSYGSFAQTLAVAVDADGRPVTAGNQSGAATEGVFVRKYDVDGEEAWLFEQDEADPVSDLDLLLGVAVDSTGHVVASGMRTQATSYDFWILKLTP